MRATCHLETGANDDDDQWNTASIARPASNGHVHFSVPAEGPYSAAQHVVAADGRFLMNVDAPDTAAPPINVVLNWTTGLNRTGKLTV